METKTERADQPRRPGPGDPVIRSTSEMKRSHWIIFFVICLILGILVFATVVHVIDTTPSRARLVNAPTPVETIPVRRQDLDELIPRNPDRRSEPVR